MMGISGQGCGHLHAFDRRCANSTNMKTVWFGALYRGIYQGRVG